MNDRCPRCSAPFAPADTFCEACGAGLVPDAHAEGAPAATAAAAGPAPGPTVRAAARPVSTVRADRCRQCGGDVLDDGFCSVCGQRAPTARDHWAELPVAWLGGVCDRGVAHARNEDAMALAGLADRSLGVLVVCDGVTTAPDSDRASLAAARAACAALAATPPAPLGSVAGTVSHWGAALTRSCTEAQAAVVAVARMLGDPPEPPSCTFVAAVVVPAASAAVATVAWCGDSRAYWLPDGGAAEQVTVDHSLGTEMVLRGMNRDEAERDPKFHTITSWLGPDTVDATPDVASRVLDAAGWLLVCSDGLWNYASTPQAMAAQVQVAAQACDDDPVQLADHLVRWANEQGGHDNITAALARWEPGA